MVFGEQAVALEAEKAGAKVIDTAGITKMAQDKKAVKKLSKEAEFIAAPNMIVRATEMRKPTGGSVTRTFVVTYGRPNFRERAFIRLCQKAGEPFPVFKLRLKSWPAKKASKRRG